MSELWRRCPNASPRSDEYGWGCDCHGLGRYATLVPVAAGAVLIENPQGLRDDLAWAILGTQNVGGVVGIDPLAAADRVLARLRAAVGEGT